MENNQNVIAYWQKSSLRVVRHPSVDELLQVLLRETDRVHHRLVLTDQGRGVGAKGCLPLEGKPRGGVQKLFIENGLFRSLPAVGPGIEWGAIGCRPLAPPCGDRHLTKHKAGPSHTPDQPG